MNGIHTRQVPNGVPNGSPNGIGSTAGQGFGYSPQVSPLAPRGGSRDEVQGRQFISGSEVRTVPSPTFPTLNAALAQSAISEGSRAVSSTAVPTVVIRVLPGVYQERLNIGIAAVLVGAGDGMPTIRAAGPDGIKVTASCVLRRLRLCTELGGHALSVQDASPLIEGCEILGAGGEPARGAPAGLDVRGTNARPIIRSCRISAHAGAGVTFASGSKGLLAGCDISRCGCGVWVDGGADPLIWRNTVAGHRGAGIVVRGAGAGCMMGNAVLRNGAGGILVESARRAVTAILQNRVWANTGNDIRQSPSRPAASEVGVLLMHNTVGGQNTGSGGNPGIALSATWPKRVVHTAAELVAAVRDAPRDRTALVELVGRIDLEEPLHLDRPVVIAGAERGVAELWGPEGAEAAVLITAGGESAALWWLTIGLQGRGGRVRAGASCVEVSTGRPVFFECDFNAAGFEGDVSNGARERVVLTHAVRAIGVGVTPLLAGCTLRNAAGAGLLLDRGATASLLQCEVCKNQQGGVFLGEGASLVLEACEVRGNGHFGIVVGPHASKAFLGRTTLVENVAGSIWQCGGGLGPNEGVPGASAASQQPVWVDQCCLSGAGAARGGSQSGSLGPAIVVGPGAATVMWEGSIVQQSRQEPVVRVEADASAVVAMDGANAGLPGRASTASLSSFTPTTEWPTAAGSGQAVRMDISGSAPPMASAMPPSPSPSLAPASPMPATAATSGESTLPIPPRLYAEEEMRRVTAKMHGENRDRSPPRSPAFSPASRPRSPRRSMPATWSPQQQSRDPRNPIHQARYSDPSGMQRPPQGPERPKTMPSVPQAPPPAALERARTEPVPLQTIAIDSVQQSNSQQSVGSPTAQAEWEAAMAAVTVTSAASPPAVPVQSQNMSAPQLGPDGEDRHTSWLRTKMQYKISDVLSLDDTQRKTLYELLSMLAIRSRCPDVLDIAGLGGQLKPGDTVFIRGHTGLYLGCKGEHEIMCNKANRGEAAAFTIESKAPELRHSCKVLLRMQSEQAGGRLALGVAPGGEVRALPGMGGLKGGPRDANTQFVVSACADAPSSVVKLSSGMSLYLRSVAIGKNIDVEGEFVRARTIEKGTLQRLVMEKVPPESEVPPPCSDRELTHEEQAWLFRRGVQLALVDKQSLAQYLSGHKGDRPELLRHYTNLWEVEWQATRPIYGDGGDESGGGSPASGRDGKQNVNSTTAQRRSTSRPRGRTMDKLFDMFSGISGIDKANGDMFVDAMRCFFATALRMSQLEADCVQRVIEAFAAALVNDKQFIDQFTPSMLPEKERKEYRTPEEVLFGLTYTTLMLNTDAHSQQVTQKMWDTKKFVGAGKGCGLTSGCMMQIFKNVQKEEI